MSEINPACTTEIDPSSLAQIWAPKIPASVSLPQINHRASLLSCWTIAPGSRILEIGCGQGDTTAVLAALVGPAGRIIALDPADPSYGSPLTLGEAQGSVLASEVGGTGVVQFLRDDVEGYVASHADQRFDAAVWVKSLWYFASREVVLDTFKAVGSVASRVCVAEYSLASRNPGGTAHLLASMAQGALYAAWKQVGGDEEGFLGGSNLRVLLSPEQIKEVATEAGLRLVSEGVVESSAEEELQDGSWDTYMVVKDKGFLEKVKVLEGKAGGEQPWGAVVRSLRDAAVQEVLKLAIDGDTEAQRLTNGLKRVRTMDVWVAEFEVAA